MHAPAALFKTRPPDGHSGLRIHRRKWYKRRQKRSKTISLRVWLRSRAEFMMDSGRLWPCRDARADWRQGEAGATNNDLQHAQSGQPFDTHPSENEQRRGFAVMARCSILPGIMCALMSACRPVCACLSVWSLGLGLHIFPGKVRRGAALETCYTGMHTG